MNKESAIYLGNALIKAATLQGKAKVAAAELIGRGLFMLGVFLGLVYPLLTAVLA